MRKYVNTWYIIGNRDETLKKKTSTRRSQAHAAGAKTAGSRAEDKPVALTLKVDHGTYVRLCTLGATERRTNQDILLQALQQYLDRARS